ncbi:MAG: phosphoenolpyruvate carboxylase, partial [Chlamydiia bacterium]|nr:phosphoenolpyruvate carboxylase [Chlamydiia bacterium]
MNPKVAYDTLVRMKYELFNSLFLTLPFPNLEEVGIKLPLFAERCRFDLEQGKSPAEIVEGFFQDIFKTDDEKKRLDVLFLFTQFIERQVVLFDALEQAAFSETHPRRPLEEVEPPEKYRTRIVLTAHPTQFYPEPILKIIDALADAVKKDELKELEEILLQLGMTSFRNKEQPTPLSEAAGLLDRVGKVFYEAILNLESEIAPGSPAVELGFWPGGDRDGNPFVTVETTLDVASRLRENALSNYRRELDALKRRLTFPGMAEHLQRIEEKLESYETPKEL